MTRRKGKKVGEPAKKGRSGREENRKRVKEKEREK